VRHDRGQHGANVLGRRFLALRRREEITGKAKLIVDFDQEVEQFYVIEKCGAMTFWGEARLSRFSARA
jgi:hypothetical protein